MMNVSIIGNKYCSKKYFPFYKKNVKVNITQYLSEIEQRIRDVFEKNNDVENIDIDMTIKFNNEEQHLTKTICKESLFDNKYIAIHENDNITTNDSYNNLDFQDITDNIINIENRKKIIILSQQESQTSSQNMSQEEIDSADINYTS